MLTLLNTTSIFDTESMLKWEFSLSKDLISSAELEQLECTYGEYSLRLPTKHEFCDFYFKIKDEVSADLEIRKFIKNHIDYSKSFFIYGGDGLFMFDTSFNNESAINQTRSTCEIKSYIVFVENLRKTHFYKQIALQKIKEVEFF